MNGSEELRRKAEANLEPLKGKRILVAEDNELVRVSLVDVLESEGAEVIAACDGSEALEVIRREYGEGRVLHLISTDNEMPGISGIELARRIHEGEGLPPELRNVPIILTASPPKGHEPQRLIDQGVINGFVPKPFDADDLIGTASTLLVTTQGE